LFESRDKLNSGYLSSEQIAALNIGQAFHATPEQIDHGKKIFTKF